MKWVEIITLRVSGTVPSQLADEFLKELDKVSTTKNLEEIRMYRNSINDVSIHIHWKSEQEGQHKSAFGLTLSQALKDYGLLNHSVWLETAAIEYPSPVSGTPCLRRSRDTVRPTGESR
jgi:hypothetical protein